MRRSQHSRRGAVMIVVMGLITILLSLALGVTVKVYNGIKNGSNVTQNAQAWIMMQSARMFLANQVNKGIAPWPASGTAVTIGNLQATDISGKAMDDRLGWARVKQIDTGASAYYHVMATGGGSGQNGLKDSSLTDGDPVRNAMDIRYLYHMKHTAVPLPGYWSITLLQAATETYSNPDFW